MTLYHGGLTAIPSPRIIRGDRIGDFGVGFYTTTDLEQARRFEFVFANRRVALYEHGYDLVFGPVANDQVYASLSLFEDGQIGHEELIRRLLSRKLVDQLLFHTVASLGELRYESAVEVICSAK